MSDWKRVKWTEAGQIAERLAWEEDLGEDARATPRDFYEKLRRDGRMHDAAFFLGQALPRYETVAWAARAVRDMSPPPPRAPGDADALKAALLWVQDPTETRRRAAYDAASRVAKPTPARMLALATFFSGGSIVPENCPPVPAPQEVAGRLAAGAVLIAAVQSGDQAAALAQALDAGVALAEGVAPA